MGVEIRGQRREDRISDFGFRIWDCGFRNAKYLHCDLNGLNDFYDLNDFSAFNRFNYLF